MQLHYADLHSIFPATPKAILEDTVAPLNAAIARYDISTGSRAAAFLAQVGHESGGFVAMAENLNYSAKGLRGVFGKYFPTNDLAEAYERQPQKIASRVYANRMGNGTEASKEGWTYRGRGFLQLTGKDTYESFGKAMKMSLTDTITYLETREGAAMSAGWFWNGRALNTFADQGRFSMITQRINGGQNGAEDREAIFARAKKLLG